MQKLSEKRLLICEEALLDFKGHFYSWIKAIRAINKDAGVEVLVAGNKDVKSEIRKEFDVLPVYTHNNWSGIYDYRHAWRRYFSVFMHNRRILKQTRSVLRQTGPVDCIILTAVRIHHLLAWKKLCNEGLGKDFNRVVLFVLTSEAIYDESYKNFHFKRSSALMKFILKSFKREVANGQVILAGDSHITCKEYESLAGVPFKVFPSPAAGLQAAAEPLGAAPSRPDTTPCFVILGVSVIDKGIDLLQEAILLLLGDDPKLKARFIIQWSTPTIDYNGNPVPISDILRGAPQVELIEHVLDEDSYREYMQDADFIVLPYRRKVYFNRISGVAVEAACAGIPMIVTENTWLSWAMTEFGAGVTVRDGDATDLADKIKLCLAERVTLSATAQERKTVARKSNSTEHYLQILWN